MLDNPVWYALTSVHAHLAVGTELAKRYPLDMAIAVGLANHSDAALADLSQLVPPGQTIGLVEANLPEHLPGWQIHEVFIASQMVSQQTVPEPPTEDMIELTNADVPDMIELVDTARPGPFLPRSNELGRFFGIRRDGKLVAMAGERLRLSNYIEISTVCTHPDWQGKGYARRLCSWIVHTNWQKGIIPYLHVNPANTTAVQLYESLHFTKRTDMKILIISRA